MAASLDTFSVQVSQSAPSLMVFVSHVARVFTHAETWLGVLVAIGFIVAAIRIRRYRDDS